VVVTINKDILVYNGHGEGDTKWKGWAWKLLLVKLVIYSFFLVKVSLYNKLTINVNI
jgi:hypothetical protein